MSKSALEEEKWRSKALLQEANVKVQDKTIILRWLNVITFSAGKSDEQTNRRGSKSLRHSLAFKFVN